MQKNLKSAKILNFSIGKLLTDTRFLQENDLIENEFPVEPYMILYLPGILRKIIFTNVHVSINVNSVI